MAVENEYIDIPTPDGSQMRGYLARPAGDEILPGVVIFMEIFGINSHIRDVTERIAAEGFVALAPDYFNRTAPGMELGYDDDGMSEGMKHLGQLQADQMISDAQATIALLESRPDVGGAGIGAMGFCIGGHMAFLTACTSHVRATASYYGGGIAAPQGPGGSESTLGRTAGIGGRIHCYFGGQDSMIPADQVDAVRAALTEAKVDHEVQVYPEADHGFHCDQRGTFNSDAAADAWQRTIALFNQQLRD
ncbi:MAG: dienelactone hydrolase family protein [Myxococcota bacterium]|jgi:carboxymethylenebutenolidase|nr:dienelactone hydrolase family protein [Myxococcota bacterium]